MCASGDNLMEDNSRFLVRATVKKLFGPTLFSGIMGAMSPILGCFLLAAFADNKSMVAASLFFPIYTLWNICGFRCRHWRQHHVFPL
jgi:hypothetical protein